MKEFQMHFILTWDKKPCEKCLYIRQFGSAIKFMVCTASRNWYGVLEKDAACYQMQHPQIKERRK